MKRFLATVLLLCGAVGLLSTPAGAAPRSVSAILKDDVLVLRFSSTAWNPPYGARRALRGFNGTLHAVVAEFDAHASGAIALQTGRNLLVHPAPSSGAMEIRVEPRDRGMRLSVSGDDVRLKRWNGDYRVTAMEPALDAELTKCYRELCDKSAEELMSMLSGTEDLGACAGIPVADLIVNILRYETGGIAFGWNQTPEGKRWRRTQKLHGVLVTPNSQLKLKFMVRDVFAFQANERAAFLKWLRSAGKTVRVKSPFAPPTV